MLQTRQRRGTDYGRGIRYREGIRRGLRGLGADLALADIDAGGLAEVAEELDAETLELEVDVSDPEQVAAMVQETKAEFSGLDVVFANAGIGRLSLPVDRYPLEEWDEVMDVNLDGVFYTVREAAASMDEGSIVTTASVLGDVASEWPGVAAYVASKGGVVQLTKQAAVELAPDIQVNAIAPGGPTRTSAAPSGKMPASTRCTSGWPTRRCSAASASPTT